MKSINPILTLALALTAFFSLSVVQAAEPTKVNPLCQCTNCSCENCSCNGGECTCENCGLAQCDCVACTCNDCKCQVGDCTCENCATVVSHCEGCKNSAVAEGAEGKGA